MISRLNKQDAWDVTEKVITLLPQMVPLDFPGGSVVKNPPPSAGDVIWSLGREDPLEEDTATHQYSRLENTKDRRAGWDPWGHTVGCDWARYF